MVQARPVARHAENTKLIAISRCTWSPYYRYASLAGTGFETCFRQTYSIPRGVSLHRPRPVPKASGTAVVILAGLAVAAGVMWGAISLPGTRRSEAGAGFGHRAAASRVRRGPAASTCVHECRASTAGVAKLVAESSTAGRRARDQWNVDRRRRKERLRAEVIADTRRLPGSRCRISTSRTATGSPCPARAIHKISGSFANRRTLPFPTSAEFRSGHRADRRRWPRHYGRGSRHGRPVSVGFSAAWNIRSRIPSP